MSCKNYHFYILTGGIKTGKSTSIYHWAETLESVGGIVQIQKDEKRYIIDAASKEKKELTQNRPENSLSVGKYYFSKDTIQWGKEVLSQAVNTKVEWLIFDEYGIGEFDNKCFEPDVSNLFIEIIQNNLPIKCVIVVREKLLQQFISGFGDALQPSVVRSIEEIQLKN
ncbi:MAG: hypothetical protein GXO87_04695 [Chlorobi bacterium]|nr:hypothetical protein [Chlorobiota bacterium]